MKTPQRNIGIDALRLFSIAMVVLGHSGSFECSTLLSIWRMPLFFILSGFFFVPYGRSLRFELSRRWETLVIPYLAWSVVISLVVIIVKWSEPTDMLHHLFTGWRGGTGRSIFWMSAWFLLSLAISAVMLRYLERFPRWIAWVVGAASILTSRLFVYLDRADILDGNPFVDVPLRLGISLPIIFYLLIGQEIRTRVMPAIEELSVVRVSSIGIVLIVGPLALAKHFSVPAHYMHAGLFGWPIVTPMIAITVTIGFIMIFATGVNRVIHASEFLNRLIGRLVRTGSTVVMFHGLVLLFVHHLGLNSSSLSDLLVRFGITLTTAFAVGLLINMSPAARVLSGVPRERPLRVTIAA
ncbi:MAG: acyltransferase [Yaniella sp.]|uniref:acyltransferase family protein n=2 Tax=Yaniella sp. TaxID=2773929 RepID=UPI002647D567|nr:acyltransferase family protein [Yaniella sp.]MDN5730822.1 acyltransferase [Yaniella sp.]MDN5814701.1 acyltransferase [Yaniella sp.]MDN5817275.1 acyltransferase [Yaniella sp.]MDN5837931.1 acyltransferase [Yaniella sp.]MDN5889204.1 acyltransferase [Yaniella sp.]